MPSQLIHASCVALDGKGVLLTGASGIGKSDVALQLIDGGASLVSDDQTELRVEGGRLMASVPPSIAGLIEVRHVGLLRLKPCSAVPVTLYVELVPEKEEQERLPEADTFFLFEQAVRRVRLPARAASTAAKIRAILRYPMASA